MPYKQLAPPKSLTFYYVMSQPGPSYCSLFLISNEAQGCNLESKVKGLGIQNLTVCMGTGTMCLASGELYDHIDLVLTSFIYKLSLLK